MYLRGLDLDERGPGELGQPAGDLGLAHAGGADHHDVLRGHFLPHVACKLLPPPAVADGHRHRPLRRVLADDVPIEFFHNLPRGQVSHDYYSPRGIFYVELMVVSVYVLPDALV